MGGGGGMHLLYPSPRSDPATPPYTSTVVYRPVTPSLTWLSCVSSFFLILVLQLRFKKIGPQCVLVWDFIQVCYGLNK